MEEIKEGEYVRTNRGIGKIEEIKIVKTKMNGNHDKSYKLDIFKSLWFSENGVIKHSPNIIDLIQVGDYVNGELMTQAKYDLFINSDFKAKYAEQIKSIVTKEQFESMKYEV